MERPMRKILTACFTVITLTAPTSAETYRLIHAIGNDESDVARDLSQRECEVRKREYKGVAEALGTYSERLGVGSITCLPEEFFED